MPELNAATLYKLERSKQLQQLCARRAGVLLEHSRVFHRIIVLSFYTWGLGLVGFESVVLPGFRVLVELKMFSGDNFYVGHFSPILDNIMKTWFHVSSACGIVYFKDKSNFEVT